MSTEYNPVCQSLHNRMQPAQTIEAMCAAQPSAAYSIVVHTSTTNCMEVQLCCEYTTLLQHYYMSLGSAKLVLEHILEDIPMDSIS